MSACNVFLLFLKGEQMGRRGRKEGSKQNKSAVLRSASVLETDVL